MSAAYDQYDYPAYWTNRLYEHKCEATALKTFLGNIPIIHSILDIGAGYGRLTPYYLYRSKHITLSDPSNKLLAIARKKYLNRKNITYIHSKIETISSRLTNRRFDLILLIRVLHHIEKPDQAFSTIYNLLKPNGYFILEFANKNHFKAAVTEFIKGNFTFPMDIYSKDIRSRKSLKNKTLPFNNYHPDSILLLLKEHGFKILDKLSVSNIRSQYLKGYLTNDTMALIDKYLQKPLSLVNFGPSIFVLCQKVG